MQELPSRLENLPGAQTPESDTGAMDPEYHTAVAAAKGDPVGKPLPGQEGATTERPETERVEMSDSPVAMQPSRQTPVAEVAANDLMEKRPIMAAPEADTRRTQVELTAGGLATEHAAEASEPDRGETLPEQEQITVSEEVSGDDGDAKSAAAGDGDGGTPDLPVAQGAAEDEPDDNNSEQSDETSGEDSEPEDDRSCYPDFVEPVTDETRSIPEQEKIEVAGKLDEIIDDLLLRFADEIDIFPDSNELHLELPESETVRWSIMVAEYSERDPYEQSSLHDTALNRSTRDIIIHKVVDDIRQDRYVYYYLDDDHQAFRHNGDTGYLDVVDTDEPELSQGGDVPIIEYPGVSPNQFNVYSEGTENERLEEHMGEQNQPFSMRECRGLEEWLHQSGIVPREG